MPPMLPHEVLLCIAGMILGAVGLYLLPSCGEPSCTESHRKHVLATRAVEIEKTHKTYHSPDRPQPTCALCQGRKRDDET